MNVTASAAASAYATAARAVSDPTKDAAAKTDKAGGDFGAMVKEVVDQTLSTLQSGDNAAMAQATGKADIVDVVTAVAETEVTLRTLVSVRDRVISAYQEIMRMPI